MRRNATAAAALLVALTGFAAAQTATAASTAVVSEAEFQDALAQVRRTLASDRASDARLLLDQTLAANAAQPWAVHYLYGIEDLLQLCAFWSKYERPNPADVVSGELAAWNAGSGRIDLRYDVPPRKRAARARARSARESLDGLRTAYGRDDFVRRGSTYAHPLTFAGEYTLELSGSALGPNIDALSLFVATEWDRAFFVDFATHEAKVLAAVGSTLAGSPEQGETVLQLGEHFQIAIAVNAASISVSCNGQQVCSIEKPTDLWGGVAMTGLPDDWSVRLQGTAQGAWIQNRIDDVVQANVARFAQTYDAEAALPDALRERARQPARTYEVAQMLPGAISADVVAMTTRIAKLRDKDDVDGALALLSSDESSVLGDVIRDWLVASLLAHTRRSDEATQRLERVCAAHPEFLPARVLRAELRASDGRRAEALAEAQELVAASPRDPRALVLQARVLSLLDRADEANDVLRAGRDAGLAPADFAQMQRMLDRARNGPPWAKSFEHKTEHYQVRSDISQALCYRAAQLLERFYAKYNAHIKRVTGPKKRFRVQLFSGQASYHEFCGDILGGKPEHTAGVYIPLLKQLMIWNLPDIEQMMRTIIHEGFHQYLDQIAPTAPVWFNEGMAEYYESSKLVAGAWQDGAVSAEHVEALRRGELVPLASFVRIARADFYGPAVARNYAQAWAFVHFLKESGKSRAELIARFLKELSSGRVAADAVETVFTPAVLDGMQNEFSAYVQRL